MSNSKLALAAIAGLAGALAPQRADAQVIGKGRFSFGIANVINGPTGSEVPLVRVETPNRLKFEGRVGPNKGFLVKSKSRTLRVSVKWEGLRANRVFRIRGERGHQPIGMYWNKEKNRLFFLPRRNH